MESARAVVVNIYQEMEPRVCRVIEPVPAAMEEEPICVCPAILRESLVHYQAQVLAHVPAGSITTHPLAALIAIPAAKSVQAAWPLSVPLAIMALLYRAILASAQLDMCSARRQTPVFNALLIAKNAQVRQAIAPPATLLYPSYLQIHVRVYPRPSCLQVEHVYPAIPPV